MNLGGPRMLRGVCRFYQIVTYIIMAITILVLFFFLATGKDFIEQAIIASNQQDEDLSLVLKYFNGIIIGALVVVAIVFVFCIIYYSSVLKFAKHAIYCMETNSIPLQNVTLAAVFLFLFGIISLLFSYGSIALNKFSYDLIQDMVANGSLTLPSYFDAETLLSLNYLSLAVNTVTAVMCIFAGILAIQFNGLREKIAAETSKIPEPKLL